MAENSSSQQTSGWASLWSKATEVIDAGVGIAKDVANIKKTDAERKALEAQRQAPNYVVIGAIVGGVLLVLVFLLLLLKRR